MAFISGKSEVSASKDSHDDQDFSGEPIIGSGREGEATSGSGGDRRRVGFQRSLTTDTLETSEDSFALADTSGDNPFAFEATEYHQDPKLVNIHQFFPALDKNFNRAVSGRLREERQAIAEEDSRSITTNDGSLVSRDEAEGQSARDDGESLSKGESSPGKESERDKNNSSLGRAGEGDDGLSTGGDTLNFGGEDGEVGDSTPGVSPGLADEVSGASNSTMCEKGAGEPADIEDKNMLEDPQFVRAIFGHKQPVGGVFATAVDEETIQAARQRQNIFTADDWSEVKTATYSLEDIVTNRAYEHYQKALRLQSEEKWLDVITCLNKAINLKSDEAAFYRQRGEAYIQLCDFQSAILNYKKACLLNSSDASLYQRLTFLFYFQGQCLFDQRLYPEALEAFSKAAEMNPDNIGYHIRSISCLAALQRHGECLALVNKRLEVDHDNPDLYVMRARLHEMFRNTTLCYYDVKDALALQPEHPEALEMISLLEKKAAESRLQAMQLNIAGKHREALQKISIAIETNPSVAEYHVLRGALHRKLHDFNAAIDDFLLALDKCDHDEENPTYDSAQRQLLLTYNDFAVECFNKGFYEEAVILLNKAIKGEKNEKGLYINRGDCFFKQGELHFAMQDYQQALELDGSDAAVAARISVIHNEFGVNLYQEKNYVEAEAKFSLALQYNPHVGQYYISRSRARYMLENLVGARQDLLMGLLLDPTNEDVLSILARLFPGKSVADVISSPAAAAAQMTLMNMGPAVALTRLPPLPMPESMLSLAAVAQGGGEKAQQTEQPTEEGGGAVWKPAGCFPSLALCMEEKQFHIGLVHEKKKAEFEVKEALQNRRPLRHHGVRIQPLPPPTGQPRYGSQLKGRVPVLSPAVKQGRKPSGYNWRTFSLGIGIQDS